MINSLNGTSLLNRLRQAVHNKMHGANIFWWCWKKVWQVYTNALHREKLWNHCIQVWRWKMTVPWDKYFPMKHQKKRDKSIQMHYIGKSYVNTGYKCDDEKIDRFLGQIFSDDSEKKAWQVYTNALHREKLCKHCIQVWRWKKIWSL